MVLHGTVPPLKDPGIPIGIVYHYEPIKAAVARWCPSYDTMKWLINRMKTIDISPTETLSLGVICTNSAIKQGHHFVTKVIYLCESVKITIARSWPIVC